jgi:hypothetical protein
MTESVWRIVIIWLIISELIVIYILLKGKPMREKWEALFLIAGFFVIGFIMASALP